MRNKVNWFDGTSNLYCIWQAAIIGINGQNSKAFLQGHAINICWALFWDNDRVTMEDKTILEW